MFEGLMKIFSKLGKKEEKIPNSKVAAKERLHLVLMQDRANVSADFLELMKQEIIDVIKKYIEIDENAIDVRLTNKENDDGTNGAPALYANIPIINIKNETRKIDKLENVEKSKDIEKSKKDDKKEKTEKVSKAKTEESKKEEKQKENNTLEEKNKTVSLENNEDDSKKMIEKKIENNKDTETEEVENTENKNVNKKQNKKTTSKSKSKN